MHSWQRVPNSSKFKKILLFCQLPQFQILPTSPPPTHPQLSTSFACYFCWLVSLTEWMIVPHLMCYFTQWYYESTNVDPWYLVTRRTLLCVLYNQSHKKRKDSPKVRTIFSSTLILTWTFEGDQSDSASTFFKIASASWF